MNDPAGRAKRRAPSWWHALHPAIVEYIASQAPLEAFGFFVRTPNGKVRIQTVPVRASQNQFQVPPQVTIDVCYQTAAAGAAIVGTFHSHPSGRTHGFSDGDSSLLHWGQYHVVYVLDSSSGMWQTYWHEGVSSY